MPKLPVVSGNKALRAFEKDGWIYKRKHGSHMIMVKPDVRITLSIPDHRELDRGLLRDLISDAGLTVQQFAELLD